MENKNVEYEIARRTAEVSKKNYTLAIIISIGWIILSFMINCFIAIGNGYIWDMFEGGLYWIGFGNMILGLVMAIIFLLLHLRPAHKMSLVLTNKRLYLSISKKLIFSRTLEVTDSYNLNKVVSYGFVRFSNKKRSISQLQLKTAASQVGFIVDVEFYNEFVNAVNNAV